MSTVITVEEVTLGGAILKEDQSTNFVINRDVLIGMTDTAPLLADMASTSLVPKIVLQKEANCIMVKCQTLTSENPALLASLSALSTELDNDVDAQTTINGNVASLSTQLSNSQADNTAYGSKILNYTTSTATTVSNTSYNIYTIKKGSVVLFKAYHIPL